jgi:hypothetical protein
MNQQNLENLLKKYTLLVLKEPEEAHGIHCDIRKLSK